MPKTRSSLYFLATYLLLTGVALFLAPQFTLKLLFANHEYPDAFVRFSGILMVALAIIVVNVILYGGPKMYRASLLARIPMWFLILILYFQTGESAFVIILGVLGLGVVVTGSCYLSERKQAAL